MPGKNGQFELLLRDWEELILPPRRSVYLADDHVLCVSNNLLREQYRRFYYRDIQAIIILRTTGGKAKLITWSILAALWGILMIQTAMPQWLWAAMVVMAIPICLQIYRGGSCDCQVQTAVSLQEVPAVKNMRAARRFLAAVGQRVQAVQGQLQS